MLLALFPIIPSSHIGCLSVNSWTHLISDMYAHTASLLKMVLALLLSLYLVYRLIGEIGITTLGLDDTDFISIIITGHDIAENQLLNSKFGTKSLTIGGIKHCIL